MVLLRFVGRQLESFPTCTPPDLGSLVAVYPTEHNSIFACFTSLTTSHKLKCENRSVYLACVSFQKLVVNLGHCRFLNTDQNKVF